MAVQKQNMPSFASIISILSIVFYCAGFLRVELELHEQKKRINALESVAVAKSPSNDAENDMINNDPGKCLICNAVAIRTAPVRRLVFAIRTGVGRFHRISLLFPILAYPNYYICV